MKYQSAFLLLFILIAKHNSYLQKECFVLVKLENDTAAPTFEIDPANLQIKGGVVGI